MDVTRRALLKAGIGSGAALLLTSGRLGAQPAPLIERAIPSSGERLPVIGIGTARRWEQVTTEAEWRRSERCCASSTSGAAR